MVALAFVVSAMGRTETVVEHCTMAQGHHTATWMGDRTGTEVAVVEAELRRG